MCVPRIKQWKIPTSVKKKRCALSGLQKKVYQKSFESLLFKLCTYRFVPTCGLWKHPSVISSLHGESRQMQSVLVSSSRSTNTQRAFEDDPHSSVLRLLDIFRPVKPQQPESEVIERQTGRDGNSSSDQRDGTKHSSRWKWKISLNVCKCTTKWAWKYDFFLLSVIKTI